MTLSVWPVRGIGEIAPGADLAVVVVEHLAEPLANGDVVVVTSKVVSKAEGLATAGDRDSLLEAETDHVVARRGQTRIVRTHSGLVLAAAGIDLDTVTQELETEGVDKFAASFRSLLSGIDAKAGALAG